MRGDAKNREVVGKSKKRRREEDSELIASLRLKKKKTKKTRKNEEEEKTKSFEFSKKRISKSKLENQSGSEKSSLKKKKGKNVKGNVKEADGDIEIKKLRRRRRRKKKKKVELDEPSRLQRRTRYLLIKMKLEQNLIDAYSAEGWKGQSREKIRPETELQRAKDQILKCKLAIRDALHQLHSLSSVGSIDDSFIAPDGSVHHEHIICAKCNLREAFPDDDIVLCDGTCNRGFHQKCHDPPLDIDSSDQGWFCRLCECKMEIIEAMNAHIGTHYSVDSNWQDIFKEEAAFPDGNASLNQEPDWPSDDSEDYDYDPERVENSCSINASGSDDDASSSTSLRWSSDDEAFLRSRRWKIEGLNCKNYSADSSMGSDETSDAEIIYGRRQRQAVDYRKLYDEMFGKDAAGHEQVSEDEDWGPAKRGRREKESEAVSTLMTLYGSKEKRTNVKTSEVPKIRRSFFRIPASSVEKLREAFAENELPPRSVKENLSKELGLTSEKVNKWFKNARYIALKARKAEGVEEVYSSARNSKVSKLENEKVTSVDHTALKDAIVEVSHDRHISKKADKNSSDISLEKTKHKTASSESPSNSNQANIEFSDDMSLKKLLKAKSKKEKKKVKLMAGGLQAAEAEMERLCRAKIRLEYLKQTLLRLQNRNSRKSNKSIPHESVIYIPIAELREKV